MRYQLIVSVSFAALTAGQSGAQTVTGRLIDANSEVGIANGTIAAVDSTGSVLVSVLTDSAGRFAIELAGYGVFSLRAERIGYRTSTTEPFQIASGVLEVEFRLSTEAVLLDPITVTTESRPWWETQRRPEVWGLYQRMSRYGRTGFGRFITNDDLERYRQAPAWVLFGDQIGFGIHVELEAQGSRRSITMRGPLRRQCNPVYFVDGLPFRAEESVVHTTIEAMIAEERIEGIEMFSPWYVPSEFTGFLRHDEACVIAIWTRNPDDPPLPLP